MATHQDLSNFIWQIADLLRGPYRPPQYERVMLPMTVLRRFEDKDDHTLRRQLELVLGDPTALDEIVANLGKLGVKIADVAYERRLDEDKQRVGATLNLAFSDKLELSKLLHEVERVAGVRRLNLRAAV